MALPCLYAAGPFSHQLHLKLKLACTTCHANAATSQATSDNLLPAAKACTPCHTQGPPTAIKEQRKVGVQKFPHATHAKLPNIAPLIAAAIDKGKYLGKPAEGERALLGQASNNCEACHRGLHQNAKVDADVFPHMSDCLVCHSKIEPPFSCETCHDKSVNLMPANHDDKWLDFHASGKAGFDKLSCQPCHGQQFTCRGCH
jgi:hypothetical protein